MKKWTSILFSMGGRWYDTDGNVIMDKGPNKAAAEKALQVYIDLVRNYKTTPPDITTYRYPNTQEALQQELVPLAVQWNAAPAALLDPEQSPKIYDKIAVSVIPGVRDSDGSVHRTPYLHALTFYLNAKSPRKKEAAHFAIWYSQSEYATFHAAHDFGSSPGVKSIYTNQKVIDKYGSWWKVNLETMQSGSGFAAYTEYTGPRNYAMGNEMVRGLTEGLTAEEILRNACAKMREVEPE